MTFFISGEMKYKSGVQWFPAPSNFPTDTNNEKSEKNRASTN